MVKQSIREEQEANSENVRQLGKKGDTTFSKSIRSTKKKMGTQLFNAASENNTLSKLMSGILGKKVSASLHFPSICCLNPGHIEKGDIKQR